MVDKAFAKINISLNVVDKKPDGYHNIETIMIPLEFHDSLEIEISNRFDDDFVICDDYNVGISKYNLCHKAISVAREEWGFKQRFDISIHKNIFLQSGLGGGSADAACVIRAIVKLLNIKTTKEKINEVAKKVGADVPFMLTNKPAVVTGIGDSINYFNFDSKYRDYFVLLVKPLKGLSTTEVYEEYDKCEQKHFDIPTVKKCLVSGDENLKNYIGNSLELPAFEILPELKELKQILIDKGFELVFMTGGGSCLVAMTDNKKLAKKTLKEYYLDEKYECELTKILKRKK